MTNLVGQEPWELRGANEARIRALEKRLDEIATTYALLLTSGVGQPQIIIADTQVVNADGSGNADIVYDTAFPNDTLMAVCNESQGIDRIAVPRDPAGGSWTASGFGVNIRVASTGAVVSGTHRVNFIAIGY